MSEQRTAYPADVKHNGRDIPYREYMDLMREAELRMPTIMLPISDWSAPLSRPCLTCMGVGDIQDSTAMEGYAPCGACEGKGAILAPHGRAIMALIKRHG